MTPQQSKSIEDSSKRAFDRLRQSPVGSVLVRLENFLSKIDTRGYIVGGFVRDILLGRETADIDIAVAGNALEIGAKAAAFLGGCYVPLDVENRIARVVLDKNLEIDFSSFEGDIEKDLGRRDFTINAMAVELRALLKDSAHVQVMDPFNGKAAIRRKSVSVVDEGVFGSDPIRVLRAIRICGELNFKIARRTQTLIRRDAHLLKNEAGERMREELLRILSIHDGTTSLSRLDKLDLLTELFPEMACTKGVAQPKEHHWDVFQHLLNTAAAVDFLLRQGNWRYHEKEVLASVPWNEDFARHFSEDVSHGSSRGTLLKLAALLHDVGKPASKFLDANGRIRFFGHARESALMASNMLSRLRFSNREIHTIETEIENHMRPGQINQQTLPTSRAIYRYFRDTGDEGIDILFLSLADHLAARGPDLILSHWRQHTSVVEYVLDKRLEQNRQIGPQKLIDGNDLIESFGMEPGPKIGEILESIRERQAAGKIHTKEEALKLAEALLTKPAAYKRESRKGRNGKKK